MGTELNYVHLSGKNLYVRPSETKGGSSKVVNISIVGNPSTTNTDSFKGSNSNNLSQAEKIKYDAIYQRIAEICKDNDIDINLAKSFGLLEKIAGAMSPQELIKFSPAEIEEVINLLDNSLGWGDGLGFGEKDIKDLSKLVEKINIKSGYEKTGGSKFGQFIHNITKGIKDFFGVKTVAKLSNSDEVTNYYRDKYLKDIQNVSEEEKYEIYQKLLKDFYYDFNTMKDPKKKVKMLKAIENLAANDRLTMIKVVEKCFMHDKNALALFGKTLEQDFESIVTNIDGFNNTVGKLDAANISHIAFKNMLEEDVNNALVNHKEKVKAFLDENGELIQNLRVKKANGDALTSEEENKLLLADCYEAKYAGALTGTFANYNLNEYSRTSICSKISNDTEELGIQEEVFTIANQLVEEHPEIIPVSKEDFTQTMDKASKGKFSGIIKTSCYSNKEQMSVRAKHITKRADTQTKQEVVTKQKCKESPTTKKQDKTLAEKLPEIVKKESETTESKDKSSFSRSNSNKTNTSVAFAPNINSKKVSKPTERESFVIKALNSNVLPKETDIKKLATLSVDTVERYALETKIDKNDLAINLLNQNNLDADIKDWALSQFESLNENQKAINCNRITINENKIEAGKCIRSLVALEKVECNNAAVQDFFDALIEERKKAES